MTTYVIRGYHWGYNDETFYPEGSYIHSSYKSEEEATKAWKKLELEHWGDMNAYETHAFFDNHGEELEKLVTFYKEKTGKTLETDDWGEFYISAEFEEDDAIEFLKLADLQAYKITKFDQEPEFYAIYLLEEDRYLTVSTEDAEILVYGSSIDELIEDTEEHLCAAFDYESKATLKGDFAELSDSPNILENTVQELGLKYNPVKKTLVLDTSNSAAVFSINDLLKKPIFDVKKLSLAELQEIEGGMNSYDEGEW